MGRVIALRHEGVIQTRRGIEAPPPREVHAYLSGVDAGYRHGVAAGRRERLQDLPRILARAALAWLRAFWVEYER